ncbi:exodeoxyribonuclease VII large subunit [Saccharococcus caldoxylosilyticus]|uniref:Exodeoxyribonuclease 7 large subunit n=2 Tax=Saccharococcus caldoxylosilyticus TaxID=81408 RepID=A0A023DDW8_9BACL|nr:exodeoxyribonuclease VII large subunit [Parageobacillus caldoxylosilyticus]OQP04187.1 exodeoxyribonuclease VII large subunit [Geobacillus sp. 44B]KYD09710.1 Exodeoxyribonuclease VII large subunit [Parageobacillus caldoxylosilyticus]MBB3852845.1 exodeoxyribonuclease VII large subunit [Parageobacillus caldoxylosilyticus]QNU36493.1 exodeoxyribonuclease VII large subunit [Geobacillus sp. 44B]QXJ39663.1 Exodeoxyribonuclease 7 large subunit [Parageobacillus caldoxylosilyticus]
MAEIKYVTVGALTKYIKRKFDVDPHLRDLWIKGEISNFKYHSRGHMYFTLKDEQARIQAVMFAGYNQYLHFRPEDGMKVLVRGEISVYEPSGNYQIYVKEMQPEGIGNLYLAYEQLKKRLEAEGLFSPQHKKPLPAFPRYIGVATSPTGAAIRDIITTIRRRYPIATIILFPTLVQGEHAAESIVRSIEKANELGYIDVLIVGRGGGSIEELWAFNEEIVARAIFASEVPIISAVGHETDFTIADFVADLRAPTPTGAAELAVPHITELIERISQRRVRLIRAMKEKIAMESERLSRVQKSYAFRYPEKLYEQKEQQLDALLERLQRHTERMFDKQRERLEQLRLTLLRYHPAEQLSRMKEKQQSLAKTLEKEMRTIMHQHELRFASLVSHLHALSPLKIMERGYSLVYNEKKELVKSIRQLQIGDMIQVRLQDGQIDCHVWGMEEKQLHE